MPNSTRLIILCCLLFASSARAVDVFVDPLYWRATEAIDWVLINDTNTPNQNITYKTIDFNYAPGLRAGIGFEIGDWDSKLSYTWYHTKESDSVSGNLVSTFLGGKLIQDGNFFYQSGQINFTIDFNMLDWDFGKPICVTESLMLRPIIGLRGAKINQTIISSFQGQVSLIENVKNNSKGIGPKAGIEGEWQFCRFNDYQFSLTADFTTSYLWSRWHIRDIVHDSLGRTFIVKTGKGRNFGAFTLQGEIGLNLEYDCFSMKISYEIGDWYNQFQILDDGTGARNSHLVLQGLTLRFAYDF